MDWFNDPNLSDSEKVKMYLQNKGREQAEAQNEERQSGLGWAQFAAGIGDAFAGRSAAQTAQNFDKIRANIKDQTVGEYDRKKKSAFEDYDTNRKVGQNTLKDDPNSEESKMARTLALDMGMDPKLAGSMTATQFENLSPYLKAKYEAKIREMDRRELRADRNANREVARMDRMDKINDKKEERDLALAVPGYERTGEVLPKAEEAMKLRKATATSKQLSDKLNRMKELVSSNGSFEWGGDAGTEMESLATEIQLLGKSPELYELGVLAGPDLTLLQKITADPSSIKSLFTKDGSRLKQIDSQLSSIGGKLDATASSLGYRKAGEKNESAKTVVDRQINQKTGQTRLVYSDGSTEIVQSVAGGK